MKEIPLTKGKVAIVDDEDFEWLNQRNWHVQITVNSNILYATSDEWKPKKRKILMHRYILGLTDPKILVDHKDHDGLNNQRHNLRPCTKQQNQKNMASHRDSSSKYVGVGFRPGRGKFRARIWDGKDICLGHFINEIDAAKAYNEAAIKIHGEFANLNIV